MKTFLLFYREGEAFIRQQNTLQGLISPAAYQEHEQLFNDNAVRLINPVYGQSKYFETEVAFIWQFRETEDSTWIDCGEPAFIDSRPEQYRQIAKALNTGVNSYQGEVRQWIVETFSEEVANDQLERAFRFLEEALELVQACGLTMQDVQRQVVYTLNRPVGEISQEVGGVMVTLAGLCHATGISMLEAAQTELQNNWIRKEAIRKKWLSKQTINPIR